MNIEEIQLILKQVGNYLHGIDGAGGISCQPCQLRTWKLLKRIWCILTNKKFGLKEIKCEIMEIERKLDQLVCNGNNNGDGAVGGPISTGPFFVRTGQNNAINVKVQNIGDEPIDVIVRLFDIGKCPPVLTDEETLTAIGGGCCAQDAVLTAPAGNMEVAVCPNPANAAIRAFVSLHSGNAPTSEFEYVFRASEMLPVACGLCEVLID